MSNEQQEQVKCVSGQTHSFFQKQSPAALFGSKARTSARAWRLSPACPGGHRLPSAVGKLELASDARRASGERPVFREPLKGSGRSENDTGGSATAKLWVAAPFQGGVSLTEASY